jgi:hypothetical protein
MIIDDLKCSYERLIEISKADHSDILQVLCYFIYRIKELNNELDDKVFEILNNGNLKLNSEQIEYVNSMKEVNSLINKYTPLILLYENNNKQE